MLYGSEFGGLCNPGPCQDHARNMPEPCQDYARTMPGPCQDYAMTVPVGERQLEAGKPGTAWKHHH